MATVTPPRTTRNLEQDRSRIKSPLARLRKYIRVYVSLEGAALVGLFLALVFWVGMFFDYGFFKIGMFLDSWNVDWVQDLPWGFRLSVLLLLIATVIAIFSLMVLTRLFRDFTDAAVAIVLERRFPALLGDRLITSVELSDPEAAAKLGYSAALVQETIHEAAERVDQVPVKEVFDWSRLIRAGVLFGVLTVGLYALVGAGFCAVRAAYAEPDALAGYSDLNEASTIWFERNILLRNIIWPRRSALEIVGFPDELRIPRESAPPNLRVRAWKYVIADSDAPEGWRLLTWTDLTNGDLAGDVASIILPFDWTARDEKAGFSVDEVELKLDAFPLRTSLPGGELPAKWCIASAQAESGWRPLLWSDLKADKLGGVPVPAVPGEWDAKARAAAIATGFGLARSTGSIGSAGTILAPPKAILSMSVDDVEKHLKALDAGKPQLEKIDAGKPQFAAIKQVFERLRTLSNVRDALDRLDAKLADRSMRRLVRKLIVPENVTLVYKGSRTRNANTMTRVADNEFTGGFGELKESVTFTVRGEDYVTARRSITVVERPRLEKLESEEERPAYLYYRPATDGSATDLRGRRQRFAPVSLSVSGDATTIDVPAGTSLALTATVTKDLTGVSLFVEKKDARGLTAETPELLNERNFRVQVPDVRREQRFTLRFTDRDGVTSERKIVITAREDVSPRVREFNPDEVIRRAKEGYVVGVGCRIPFKAKVRDDHGLSRIRYACRVIPGDFLSEQKVRALFGVGVVGLLAPGSRTQLLAAGYLMGVQREMAQAVNEEATPEQFIEVPAFAREMESTRLSDGRREFLEMGTILTLLEQKQREPYRKLLSDFSINPDNWMSNDEDPTKPNTWVRAQDQRAPLLCDLPLWKLVYRDREGKERPLKDPDDTKPQKRFLVEVRLITEDTYIEGDLDPKTKQPIPHTSPSGETFTFVIVPENELLSKIGEEEETRYRELQKAFKPLPDYQNHVRDVHFSLSSGAVQPPEMNAFIARCDALIDTLKTSQQDTKAVASAYERIIREMRTNQLREDVLNKVYRTISAPLTRVAETQFDQTISAVNALRKALDTPDQTLAARTASARPRAATAQKHLEELVAQLNSILAAMEGLATLNALIDEIRKMEERERDLESLLIRVHKKRFKQLLESDGKD